VPGSAWRQASDVFWFDTVAFGHEVAENGVHIDRVPEHDEIDHESECPQLVFLALAVTLSQFSTLSMKDGPGELVAAFLS
jgi:hypothetical protein